MPIGSDFCPRTVPRTGTEEKGRDVQTNGCGGQVGPEWRVAASTRRASRPRNIQSTYSLLRTLPNSSDCKCQASKRHKLAVSKTDWMSRWANAVERFAQITFLAGSHLMHACNRTSCTEYLYTQYIWWQGQTFIVLATAITATKPPSHSSGKEQDSVLWTGSEREKEGLAALTDISTFIN